MIKDKIEDLEYLTSGQDIANSTDLEFVDHSDEIQEIIHDVPVWIFRYGISVLFALLCLMIFLSATISYPDEITTTLKINSINSPRSIVAKHTGKIVELLVPEGDSVKACQPLAYMESTANPHEIEKLRDELKVIQKSLIGNREIVISLITYYNLGEVQTSYQEFYQSFLDFRSTQGDGYYYRNKILLEKDINSLGKVHNELLEQERLQKLEMANSEEEYQSFCKLFKAKVISRSEFRLQENKYLSTKYPQHQSRTSMIANEVTVNAKRKEILDISRVMTEQKGRFLQSLNRCVIELDQWILDYVLTSPVSGKITYVGPIQKNQNVKIGEELFTINSGSTSFFGELDIPQFNMGKIDVGALALVRLKSYPYQEYGMIQGQVTYISDVAQKDSLFVGRISLDHFERGNYKKSKIVLKNGMQAQVSIITKEATLLQRIYRNIMSFIVKSRG
jgi:multidrug resistance efflux pump